MIKIKEYLDYQEERKRCIDFLKDKFLELAQKEYSELLLLFSHPLNEDKLLKDINEERIQRECDLEVFLNDYYKDWDLNYNDYPIKTN